MTKVALLAALALCLLARVHSEKRERNESDVLSILARGLLHWDERGVDPSQMLPIARDVSQGRIVGGEEADPGQFPFQVAIWFKTWDGSYRFCGGSILSEIVVVTAGHCCHDLSADEDGAIVVVAGAHEIYVGEPSQQRRHADRVQVHEDFNKNSELSDDIALLRLNSPFHLNDRVQPVRLPSGHRWLWGSKVTMSGWGRSQSDIDKLAPRLRFVESRVVTNLYCQLRYVRFGTIRKSHLCVSGWWARGTCQGDSGGPLVIADDGDGLPTLVGITSFGVRFGCNLSWPPVFTRITHYLDWIKKQMLKLTNEDGDPSDNKQDT